MLQVYYESRSANSRYNDRVCYCKLSLGHMLNDLFYTFCQTVVSILDLTKGIHNIN
jgi:hypothetical protein